MVNDVKLQLAEVYGATTYIDRRSLWSSLINLHDFWCILGDFNFVLYVEDVKGGLSLVQFLVLSFWTG